MSLCPATYTNYWAVLGHQVTLIRFYDQGQVVAETDFGYLPASSDKFCGNAARQIAEIDELHLARRNKPETGMAHGGHFAIRGELYLDLSHFPAWRVETRKVQEGPGYEIWAAGIELEYNVVDGHRLNATNGPVQVTAFVWSRKKYEQRDTPEKAKLDALCELYNKTVADHTSRHLSASGAKRMLEHAQEFIALLEGK